MGSGVVLRKRGGSEEAEAIAQLIRESSSYYATLAPAFFAPIDEEGLADWIGDDADWLSDPANLALVAEVHGEVAGYLEATIQEPDEAARFSGNRDVRERRVYINALLTAEAHQRKGVGTRLVEAAESWARGQGVMLSICDTFVGSPKSVPFWESRMGYERRSVRLRKRL
jgi:GNAT superfamily N-acetyltransferase